MDVYMYSNRTEDSYSATGEYKDGKLIVKQGSKIAKKLMDNFRPYANVVAIRTDAKCRARYNGWARITFAGEVAGNAIFAVYKDGVLIEYAQAVETVVTPETEYHTVTIPFAVLVGCCTTSGITIVNTGAIDTTVLNASILVVED